MAKKRFRNSGAKNCKCDKCGVEAHSIPDTYHRKCEKRNASDEDSKRQLGGKWVVPTP